MLEEHSNRIREDINEEPNQEIQDEEYEIEEEEEEDKLEEIQRRDRKSHGENHLSWFQPRDA